MAFSGSNQCCFFLFHGILLWFDYYIELWRESGTMMTGFDNSVNKTGWNILISGWLILYGPKLLVICRGLTIRFNYLIVQYQCNWFNPFWNHFSMLDLILSQTNRSGWMVENDSSMNHDTPSRWRSRCWRFLGCPSPWMVIKRTSSIFRS